MSFQSSREPIQLDGGPEDKGEEYETPKEIILNLEFLISKDMIKHISPSLFIKNFNWDDVVKDEEEI